MHRVVHGRRTHQRGAVIITVCLMLLFLLGFMGFALDLGRLFIVKSELQTAMDSCALAGAQELDRLAGARERARNAGEAAGNLNRVNLQSASWDGKGQIDPNVDISVLDSALNPAASDDVAAYVRCEHLQPDVRLWLIQAMGAFTGAPAVFSNTHDVWAMAMATRSSAQTVCPLPVAVIANGNAANLYGHTVGQWVTIQGRRFAEIPGEFGWFNLDGSQNAREARDQLRGGNCGTRIGTELGTPGQKQSIDEYWNWRFGIYKHPFDGTQPTYMWPDFSGYSYSPFNWPSRENAFPDFLTRRQQFASYDNQGTSVPNGSLATFGTERHLRPGGFDVLATPGPSGQHQQFGSSRRIATAPVINGSRAVIDFLCVFMLHPLSRHDDDAFIEIRGLASDPASGCSTNGIPGGTAGPLVPVLVR